jgi:hypothetical protein
MDQTVSTDTYHAKILQSGHEDNKGAVSGSNIVVTGAADAANTKAGSIAGAGNNSNAVITGQQSTNAVTLDNTAVFANS